MDWIHCNACSRQPGDEKDRRFALTSCGHMYCDLCVTACTKEKCKVCDSSCNTIELAAKMQPDVQHFFTEPEDILKKALKVMEFQKGHRQRLTSHRRAMIPREATAQDEIRKLRYRNSELEKQISELKAIVMHYERNSRPKSASTTPVTAKSPVWSNSVSLPTTPANYGIQSPMMISPMSQAAQQQRQSALAHHHQHSVHRQSQAVPSSASSQAHQQQQRVIQSQQQQQMSQNLRGKINTPTQQAGAKKILEAVTKLQQQQQQQGSPATSSGWVTPNRLLLRKSPSTTPTSISYHGQLTPIKSPDVWKSSPNVRTSSQLANPSMLKRLPGKISPYRGLKDSPHSASQGMPASKDRFPYMQNSQPTKFSR